MANKEQEESTVVEANEDNNEKKTRPVSGTSSGDDILSRTEAFYQKYKMVIQISVIAVVVLIGAAIAYKYFYLVPREEKAAEEFTYALFDLERGNYEVAINNTETRLGMYAISDKYGGTEAGELALYSLGISYLNLGEYQKALTALKDVDLPEEEVMLNSMRYGAMGDASVELGQIGQAIDLYQKAIDANTDQFSAPLYLKKQAMAYEMNNDWGKALDNYQEIQSDYPESIQAKDIKKYIARAEFNTK